MNLPATRSAAILSKSSMYMDGRKCPEGHIGVKHLKYGCLICRKSKEDAKIVKNKTPRDQAIVDGHKTYIGKVCKRKHNGERYSATGFCVKCKAVLNQRKREIEKEKKEKLSIVGKKHGVKEELSIIDQYIIAGMPRMVYGRCGFASMEKK